MLGFCWPFFDSLFFLSFTCLIWASRIPSLLVCVQIYIPLPLFPIYTSFYYTNLLLFRTNLVIYASQLPNVVTVVIIIKRNFVSCGGELFDFDICILFFLIYFWCPHHFRTLQELRIKLIQFAGVPAPCTSITCFPSLAFPLAFPLSVLIPLVKHRQNQTCAHNNQTRLVYLQPIQLASFKNNDVFHELTNFVTLTMFKSYLTFTLRVVTDKLKQHN